LVVLLNSRDDNEPRSFPTRRSSDLKISLGALVLALALLGDDAIIAVEMMAIKMEQGFSRLKAASFAWESTAFPMLTGTLVTAAGLLPIATAASSTGEYTRSLFQVVTIALCVSWVAAVLFIPWLGDRMLPDLHDSHLKPSLFERLRGRFSFSRSREKVPKADEGAFGGDPPSPRPTPASGKG